MHLRAGRWKSPPFPTLLALSTWPFRIRSFIPFPEVVARSVPFRINAIISPACVGYQYQRFGMSFGVKPTYFQYQIDFLTPSVEKIDFRKIAFWANFGSLRKPSTVQVKYSVRKATHKWKNWKIFFRKLDLSEFSSDFNDYYMKRHLF